MPVEDEDFDLEKELQKRLAQKRGLIKLRQKGHPGENTIESQHQVNRFTSLSRKATQTRSPGLKDQVALERENWERSAGWTRGESPELAPEKRRGMVQVIGIEQRKPVPPSAISPGETTDQLIARLTRIIQEQQKEIESLKQTIKRMER